MFCFQDINWGTFGWTLGVMLIIALVLGGLIILVSKFFSVEKDTRVDEIVEHLPKANCGACGHPGCEGFAQALVNGTADVDDCKVSSKEQKIEIANILGKSFSGGEETVAVVACNGGNNCQDKYAYQGYGNCQAQVMLSGGRKACPSLKSTGKICPLLKGFLKTPLSWCGSSTSPSSASPKSRRSCHRFSTSLTLTP